MRVAEPRVRFYTLRNLHKLPQFQLLNPDERFALRVVGEILPFRVNTYVTDHLIDWAKIPDDPIFQLTFMQRGMLPDEYFDAMAGAIRRNAPRSQIRRLAAHIRMKLNPHPAGQMTANVPMIDGEQVSGLQHKYRETCLIFPSQGQTCHAYCTFCFRWPQFVGMNQLRFATNESKTHETYLRRHKEVTDVLLTGGDPMVMSARHLSA